MRRLVIARPVLGQIIVAHETGQSEPLLPIDFFTPINRVLRRYAENHIGLLLGFFTSNPHKRKHAQAYGTSRNVSAQSYR
jgi:polyhydroxyalkanoate synthesis regulator protein